MHLGLDRIRRLLSVLGDPHKKYMTIHVAGTNGKGSVCAILSSILNEAGYRVGLYTSPHLIDYTERIRICEKDIKADEFARSMGAVKEAAERSNIKGLTVFELLTAAAFLIFAARKVDIAVIETGLGGRLDATNVIKPLVSIITNIDLEHTQILGKIIRKIAKEKAGIIKSGTPVVTQERKEEALSVIRRECKKKRASLICMADDRRVGVQNYEDRQKNGLKIDILYDGERLKGVRFPLNGKVQIRNIEAALMALMVIKDRFSADKEAVIRGLSEVRWPARLHFVSRNIMIDGAHNPSAARFLREYLEVLGEKAAFILGMQRDKDFTAFIDIIAPVASMFIVTRSGNKGARDPSEFMRYIKKKKKKVRIARSVGSGLIMAKKMTRGLICITGSIYLIGDYLATLRSAK